MTARGGMFGGDALRGIAGTIGDYLLQRNGMQPLYTPAMMQRQKAQLEDQQYQQRRGDQFEDWRKQQEFKLAHPDPANPHYFEDNSGNVLAVGPDGQPKMVYQDPNPYKLVPNGMGGVIPVNMQELMRGAGKPAAPGVTFTPINGGPAAPPPATFQRF